MAELLQTTLCYLEQNGCYLMLHRIKKKNDVNHDKWIGVGGKLDPGVCIAFAKQHKSHTDIYDIVFSQGFQILLTLDIIPLCGIDNVAFDQRIKIAFDGLYINFSSFGC